MNYLVTGAAGFLGSNFVRWLLQEKGNSAETDLVVGLDSLRPNGNFFNFERFFSDVRFEFIRGDIRDARLVGSLLSHYEIDALVNFAVVSGSDSSPLEYVQNNVEGVQVLLDSVASSSCRRFIHLSSSLVDEKLSFNPIERNQPINCYSASRVAAETLIGAAYREKSVPGMVLVPGSVHGPGQFPEYPVSRIVNSLIEGNELEELASGKINLLHCDEVSRAVGCILKSGDSGRVYGMSDCAETVLSEQELVAEISRLLGQTLKAGVVDEMKGRAGNSKDFTAHSGFESVRDIGWKSEGEPLQLLSRTVRWYEENRDWLKQVRSGEYVNFYRDRAPREQFRAG